MLDSGHTLRDEALPTSVIDLPSACRRRVTCDVSERGRRGHAKEEVTDDVREPARQETMPHNQPNTTGKVEFVGAHRGLQTLQLKAFITSLTAAMLMGTLGEAVYSVFSHIMLPPQT